MAKVWQIKGYDGTEVKFECEMPGEMSEQEISTTLQRLVSLHLTEGEIVSSSLPINAPGYVGFLERVVSGPPISYGHSHRHYTAEVKDK